MYHCLHGAMGLCMGGAMGPRGAADPADPADHPRLLPRGAQGCSGLRHDVYHEKIVCENAACPALVGKYFFSLFSTAFQQAIPPQCCMAHGTDATSIARFSPDATSG